MINVYIFTIILLYLTYRENNSILDKVFEKDKGLKESKNFNQWFNDQFDKHKLEDNPTEAGYGSWLKSDEDIVYIPNVTKNNMTEEMEKRKRHIQTIVNYTGVKETSAPVFAGSSLMEYNSNFTSNSLFANEGIGYTDLKQAYVESVIPVTEADFHKREKLQYATIIGCFLSFKSFKSFLNLPK
jgi:hypothetical protein